MTDLPVYPDSYLPADIVNQEKIGDFWTIAFLENGQFFFYDRVGFFFKITEEEVKWSANMANQRAKDTARSADLNHHLDPKLIDKLSQFIKTHKRPVD
jgi:hypothetical protein